MPVHPPAPAITFAAIRCSNPADAGQNLAVIRRLALNLLKQERSAIAGIKAKRKKAGWDFDYLVKVLSQ